MPEYRTDAVVEEVVQLIRARSARGTAEYGHTLADNPETDLIWWLEQAREEALDMAAYMTKIIHLLRTSGELIKIQK